MEEEMTRVSVRGKSLGEEGRTNEGGSCMSKG